ncbi:hypothetical protein [Streptomyces spirodelae]|uniref:Uncharacterized protein n=1 Tax=Streptomyces spirodelae TaxID=2812904 RepID=A0ABS3WT18_9ACTN|nr:hypothetical protein [Streptomyces spirodelae]MBO8186271.1 hypothetical protein [Streptomyces spirodelae]
MPESPAQRTAPFGSEPRALMTVLQHLARALTCPAEKPAVRWEGAR